MIRSLWHVSIGRVLAVVAAIFFLHSPAGAAPLGFTLLPGARVEGPAGSTVGWGYQVSNDSDTEWLLIDDLTADGFQHASPSVLFDFPVLAPGQIATLAWQPGLAGLFEITWTPGAPIGFVNTGVFTLSASRYDADPLAGGALLGLADPATQAYQASVTTRSEPPPTTVPEPGTLALVAAGLVACRRRRKSATP
jgi:hypothetical protein